MTLNQGIHREASELPLHLRPYAAEIDEWAAHTRSVRAATSGRPCRNEGVAARIRPDERDLELALERDELHLEYQPWVDFESGSYTTVEALARWEHPELGPIGPSEFIPLAERTGMIGRLGDWVIQEACRQLGVWQRDVSLGRPVRLAVNLSGASVTDLDLGR